jgi:poly(A) polymerase
MLMTEDEARRAFAVDVVRRLQAAGYQSLWAGGCVRDLILGQTPSDYDVATDATPEQVMAVLPFQAVTVGISFGVVRVRRSHRPGVDVEVEVATFRSDGAYVDGRRPEWVVFSSPELDAARRDFTINGMFLDPLTGKLIDYVGGEADLKNGVLRAIGEATARFREDKLRVLRAIRLAARFRFEIDPPTFAAIKSMAGQIITVSKERIAQELRKMLVHASRAEAMELALETGLVAAILPDLLPLKRMDQPTSGQRDGNLWEYVMRVLKSLPVNPSFTLAFAALMHDVGKLQTGTPEEGRDRFLDHGLAGARISERVCRDLKFSNAERDRITWLVTFHQYLREAKQLRESKLKRILAEPGIDELLALHRAIAVATTGNTEHVDYCDYYLKAQPSGPINPPPLITGHDLVRQGLEPGAKFAKILEQVRELQLEGQIQTKPEALEWVDAHRHDELLDR